MSLISTWSTIANDNGTLGSTPFYWPEGQAPSTVNDCARLMMATIRTQWNDAQWFNWGYTTSRVSGTSFTVVTASWNTVAVANVFATGGRIRVHDTAATLYGTITTVSVSAASVQVSFTPDAGSLTATCSAVYNSIITADSKSLPSGTVPADVVRQSGAQIWGVDAGATDDYAFNLTPSIGAYLAGMAFNFKANTSNTGAATLNINGVGATPIVNPDGSVLTSGQIAAGQVARVVYDGTNWQLTTSSSSSGGGGTGRLLNIRYLTFGTGATYTPTPGTQSALIYCQGGGGGGGGAAVTATTFAAASGGGGGGCTIKHITGMTAGYSATYTIGAGGAGGAAGFHDGADGSDTTYADGTYTLTGSKGGAGNAGAASVGTGSALILASLGGGGGSSGGDLNYRGGEGGLGVAANTVSNFAIGGCGGPSVLSGGALSTAVSAATATNGANAPTNSGAGGAGGAGFGVNANVAGGNGAAGIIIIYEFS